MSKTPRIGSQGFASHDRTQAPEGRQNVATGGARNERNPWIVGRFLAIFSSSRRDARTLPDPLMTSRNSS